MALDHVDPLGGDVGELSLGLDACGRDGEPETASERGDAAHEGLVGAAAAHARQEGLSILSPSRGSDRISERDRGPVLTSSNTVARPRDRTAANASDARSRARHDYAARPSMSVRSSLDRRATEPYVASAGVVGRG